MRGCRNLEHRCKDCGRVVCTKTLPPFIEWINIEERLPPQDCCVLVSIYDSRPKVKMAHVEITYRMVKIWYEPAHGKELNSKYGYVTHWMPLPEVAKE